MIDLRALSTAQQPFGGGSSDSATIATANAPDPAGDRSCASRTNGAGFRGLHLARRLAQQHQPVALDLLSPQVHIDPAASRHGFQGTAEVSNVSKQSAWASRHRPDVLIHLAAATGTVRSIFEQVRYRRVDVDEKNTSDEATERWGAPLTAMRLDLPGSGEPRTAAVGPRARCSRLVHLRG